MLRNGNEVSFSLLFLSTDFNYSSTFLSKCLQWKVLRLTSKLLKEERYVEGFMFETSVTDHSTVLRQTYLFVLQEPSTGSVEVVPVATSVPKPLHGVRNL